jgi:hypothetical protein
VGESAQWSGLCGASFAAQVVGVVSLEEEAITFKNAAALTKEVMATRYGRMTGPSIT